VRLEKDGYVPQEAVIKKGITPSFILNFLFPPGFVVDVISGAMWNYQPEVFMKLEPIANVESLAAIIRSPAPKAVTAEDADQGRGKSDTGQDSSK